MPDPYTVQGIYEHLLPIYEHIQKKNPNKSKAVILLNTITTFAKVYFPQDASSFIVLACLQMAAEQPTVAGFIMEDLPASASDSNGAFLAAVAMLYQQDIRDA